MNTINESSIRAIGCYIVKPIWDKGITQSGIFTGEQFYDESENPPGWFNPTSGIVVSAPKRSDVLPGDKLFFTWNGFDYTNCISPRNEQNIWAIKEGVFAFERDGVVKGVTYLLLDMAYEDEEEQKTESGIIISGFRAVGSYLDPTIVKHKEKLKLHGTIRYLPTEMPFSKILNPYTGKNEKLEPGKRVVVDDTADVPVEVNGEKLYRTRFWELIYCYDEIQLKEHGKI